MKILIRYIEPPSNLVNKKHNLKVNAESWCEDDGLLKIDLNEILQKCEYKVL